MKKYCKLICVSEKNNNKFYEMSWDGVSSDMVCTYGRVESSSTVITKPYSQWDSVHREKVRKGYVDVTSLAAEVKTVDTGETVVDESSETEKFLALMKRYTDNLVSTTYSVKASSVTKQQIEEAQSILNKLKDEIGAVEVNKLLIKLYTVIPRYMSNVKHMLLPNIRLETYLAEEQSKLDAIAYQVKSLDVSTTSKEFATFSLADILEVKMEKLPLSTVVPEIAYLRSQMSNYTLEGLYKISKPKEDKIFEEYVANSVDKTTKFLLHGTQCSSVFPIIQTGLKIRPSGNFRYSGKAYGDGNYFSEVVAKSMGYTGNNRDRIMFIYEVHTGNPFVYNGYYVGNAFPLNYKELKERGFDSTYVKAGNGLLNSEIIVYTEQQQTLRYILHFRN